MINHVYSKLHINELKKEVFGSCVKDDLLIKLLYKKYGIDLINTAECEVILELIDRGVIKLELKDKS